MASVVLGHELPFFAPVAAVVALGVSYAARLRRAGEVVAGVALGVAVGDVFVRVAGTGTWQIALVIAVAMSLAVLLEAGPILVTQAGVQASIVTTLLPPTSEGLDRWLDAVVGGAVALVAAAVVPTSPLHRPRRLTAGLLDDLAEMLLAAATSVRDRDAARAEQALQRARRTQRSLDELSDAAQEGLDVLQVSPFRRRHRTGMREIGSIAEPLDRAARGVRAVLRQVVAVARNCEPVPTALLDLVERLSSACALLAADMAAERPLNDAVDALHAVARASTTVPRSSLSGDVILGQVRSTVVDLFQVAGLDLDESLARMPPPRGQHPLGDTPPD
jgi:uncharacterized membrane protein YgaE (UPF0421/DUF939 family)